MAKKSKTSSGRGGPPNPIDIHIGDRIRARRRVLDVGQQEFAAALGVTFQQVQKYEKGHNRISGSRLFDIASVLGTDINFFFQDMDKDVQTSSPRQLAGIKGSKNVGDFTNLDSGDIKSSEAMVLLRDYNNLPNAELQKQVRDLCRLLAKENVGRKPKKR